MYSFSKLADYPKHPDTIVITKSESLTGTPLRERDIYSYYEGIKKEILKELKEKNLFVRLKTDSGFIYVRHPFWGQSEFIKINNEKQFEDYNTGRIVEFHTTTPSLTDFYVVDFDAAPNQKWINIKQITAEVADNLKKLSEVKNIFIKYTGKRSFHIQANLKKPKPIDKAREDLKTWLREAFGDRDDLVVGESPKGSKGALGVSPMKLNGGQVALWSLRVTGLCCVEVSRSNLMSFKKEDASMEKIYKKLTGKAFVSVEKKAMAGKVINAFLESDTDKCSKIGEEFNLWKNRTISIINSFINEDAHIVAMIHDDPNKFEECIE